MTTFTWTTNANGDWSTAADWKGDIAPTGTPDILLPGVTSGGYTVTIAAGETEIANVVTLGTPGKSGPTLEVAGTLDFAGSGPGVALFGGALRIDSGGLLAGGAALPESFVSGVSGLTNSGTVLADTGSFFLDANAGFVSNLSGGVLTGGTWIASGFFAPGASSGLFDWISFGASAQANVVVDDAVLTLDGPLSDIGDGSGSNFLSIAQTLGTIDAAAALNVLGDRNYDGTTALLDNGTITLGGGTLTTSALTIGASGTLAGFGAVTGGFTNQGVISAGGGVLDLTAPVTSTGSIAVQSGATLILNGATPSSLIDNGVVYAASGQLIINGALAGSGSLVVQSGATIEFATASNQAIKFSGSNATLRLDDFAGYLGTITGFAHGDSIVLSGVSATNAFVSGSSLVVMNNASTVDTIQLAGTYSPSASFSVVDTSGNAVVTNSSGAPLRQDFGFTISVDDTAGLGTAEDDAIANDLSAAAEDWAQYLTGYTTLRIQLNIVSGSGGSELANAGATEDIGTGTTLDGRQLDDPTSLIALTTGTYAPGVASDITVNFLAGNLGSIYVNPTPTPMPSGTVPSGEYDLVTVFRHELAHGFGVGGLTTPSGFLGSQETLFDHYIGTVGGTVVFTGPNAEVAYGELLGSDVPTPVPLTTLSNGEGYAHFANSTLDVNANDLMSGLGLPPGTQRDISAMDVAVLEDVGEPVTAMPCFAAGTRIRTERGEIRVEELKVGDRIVVVAPSPQPPPARGGVESVIWVGHRTIDCRRHPSPRSVWPVRISAGAFGDGMPYRDLWLSPDHAVFIENVLIPVKHLIDHRSIAQVPTDEITYYHVELPQHAILLAEGMPVESYLDTGDRANFVNEGRPIMLHPDFAACAWDANACAPLVVTGPQLEAARARVARIRPTAARKTDSSSAVYTIMAGAGP